MASEAQPHDVPSLPRTTAHYHVENPALDRKAERFLNAFAAVLHYTDYKALLDSYGASSAKCGRCVASCQVYQVSRDPRDIPCYRSNLLLDVYRRHFTLGGWCRSTRDGVDQRPHRVGDRGWSKLRGLGVPRDRHGDARQLTWTGGGCEVATWYPSRHRATRPCPGQILSPQRGTARRRALGATALRWTG